MLASKCYCLHVACQLLVPRKRTVVDEVLEPVGKLGNEKRQEREMIPHCGGVQWRSSMMRRR